MARLSQVKSWMQFWGWTNGGGPGSVKHDANGEVVARHGDGNWNYDINKAIARDERAMEDIALMDSFDRELGVSV